MSYVLLADLRDRIWTHYEFALETKLRGERVRHDDLPTTDPPFLSHIKTFTTQGPSLPLFRLHIPPPFIAARFARIHAADNSQMLNKALHQTRT